jgi:iron complex transport system substrate-binding protein
MPAYVKTYHILAASPDQFFGEIMDLARLFKVEDRADSFMNGQKKRLSSLSSKLSWADPVTVLVVRSLKDGALLTAGGPDFATGLLSLAGGENVFADLGPSPASSFGEAAARGPDYILMVNDGLLSLDDAVIALKDDQAMSRLPAVAENRILTLPEAYLQPGPRIADSVELLAKRLHPSLVH